MAFFKNYNNPEEEDMTGVTQKIADKKRGSYIGLKAKPKKRREFTKKQWKWLREYELLCFGLEPMYMDDFKDREMAFDTLQKLNIQWTRDHFAEIIANLERIS